MERRMGMELRESQNFAWDISLLLGKGAQGQVYRGTNKRTGEAVAVKVVKNHLEERELEVLKKIEHENIVKIIAIEVEKRRKTDVIIMELCRGGSLCKILEDPENCCGLSEDEFLIFLDNLYKVTKFLRDKRIAHRDLKPANWVKFEGDDGENIYKLTDFGAAKELQDNETFESLQGTADYLDPDVYAQAYLKSPDQPKAQFTASIDLWSIGTTLYQVAAGMLPFRPFRGNNDPQTMMKMRNKKASGVISCYQLQNNGEIHEEKTLPKNSLLSPALKELICPLLASLLEADPRKKINHEDFFAQVEVILSKQRLHVFYLNSVEKIRLYINQNNVPSLYNELHKWTDVEKQNQMLFFKESNLTEFTDNNKALDVSSLPSTSEDNPIILCSKIDEEINFNPLKPLYKKKPFANRIDSFKDYEIGRHNCSVAYYQKRLINDIVSRVQLIHLAVATINQVVIRQLTLASKDNLEICTLVRSLTRQFDMMKDFHTSCDSFLGMVPDQLLESKRKIVDNMAMAYQMELTDFQNLLKDLHRLNPSIESLLEQRIGSRQLLKEWENKFELIPKVKDFGKADKISSKVLERVRMSYIFISGEDNKGVTLPGNSGEETVYLMERIKLMQKMDSLENVLTCSNATFESLVSVFSDWYKNAQTAFIKPEILNKEIALLRESLFKCEANLGEAFKKYKAELKEFHVGISSSGPPINSLSKISKASKKEKFNSLHQKLSELQNIHHEIFTFFEANQELCDQLQNILVPGKE